MHMPSGLCHGACNVVFFNVQQGVQQGTLLRTFSRDRVPDKVPYRAPYRAIRVREKVPYRAPYRAIRCAIRSLVALGTLHHLIAFHLILLCPVAAVAFFIRCCTHAPIFTHLLLSSQVTVVQCPRLDLVQAPEASDVAGSKVGHLAAAAEDFTGFGEECFLPSPPAVFEATGFGNEVTLPGKAPTTKTHWCRSFKLKVRQGGDANCEGIHPPRRL